jgi:phenylalanyl-tRNA synthetase beta chain
MRVSFDWIKDFVDISAPAEEVADRLTMIGLEVEGCEIINDDTVFEVNVTPNRSDCLSIFGIAREVAAAFGVPLKMPETNIHAGVAASDIHVKITNTKLCHRYAGRLIKGVNVSDTPAWIKERLEKCGVRSLNNIVDITNYVLLELGHPLHAFDADKLSGNLIRVGTAGNNNSIVTLDEIKRTLPEESLLIWDSEKPVAIAGVMGAEGSSVTFNSKNIFLESACFDSISIRRTSKKLGLSTESSYRFERGTDIEFLENALNRAARLIQETGGGVIYETVDSYPVKYFPKTIEVSYSRVNSLLGINIKKDKMLEILGKIEIKTEDKGETFIVKPPPFRRDINEYVDVIEEIARCNNYSNIPVTIPRTVLSNGVLNTKELGVNTAKESLRKSGFHEVINYSFMNSADLDLLSLTDNDIRRKYVRLKNPLRQEESLMRTTLIASLINNFMYNLSRGLKDIRFFEISKVFIDKGGQLPAEELTMGGILYQEKIPSVWKDNSPVFFVVKGTLQAFFQEMRLSGYSMIPSEEVFLHKGKSADILFEDKKIGFVGELGPGVVDKLNLKIQKPEIIIFELNMDLVLSLLPERILYSDIPKYPSIERDIAIILDENKTSAEVIEIISSYSSPLIEKVQLFDYYKGKNIPLKKKSLAFRIIYRSHNKTLTENEIESVHQTLVEFVLKKTGGELRGFS